MTSVDPNSSRRGCEHYGCSGYLECQNEAASSFAPNATLRDAPDPMYPEGEPAADHHARLAAAADDFHDAVCTGPGVPAGFTCTDPSHARLAAGTEN